MRRLLLVYVGTIVVVTLAFLTSPYTISRKPLLEQSQTSNFQQGDPSTISRTYADSAESEQQRIKNRLELIEELLRARDVSKLPSELREARRKNLDVLRTYWKRGQFPQNTNRAGERVPFFIDAYGTPCAVGHLIIESGHREVATSIARTNNNIYADKITEPQFLAWAASSGLFPEELFLIQPNYDWINPPTPTPQPNPPRPIASTRQVRIGQGAVCYDTSSTFLMRDTTSSCGTGTTFCTTPLKCYSTTTGQYLGGSIATCRAGSGNNTFSTSAAGIGTTLLSCPDLQSCADDPRQEFITENEGWRWQNSSGFAGLSVTPHTTHSLAGGH